MVDRVEKILGGAVKNNRVAGAYLFVGGSSSAKVEMVQEFARLLDCKKQDIFEISPSGASIKIEQIRELSSWVRFGPSAGKYLLAIIEEADKMTPEAAAAFLKTLEEPASGVVFVLIAEREEKLPETIISRCQKIIFPETLDEYQEKEELIPFYEELKNLKKKSIVEILGFSTKLHKEKERIEDLLYDLVSYSKHRLNSTKFSRLILDAIRAIKKRANLKLALDVMCLKLALNHARKRLGSGLAQT